MALLLQNDSIFIEEGSVAAIIGSFSCNTFRLLLARRGDEIKAHIRGAPSRSWESLWRVGNDEATSRQAR